MPHRTLFAFYDLSVSPISFDFASFLVCADVHRSQSDFDAIHFVIVPPVTGRGHWDNKLHADDHLAWRMSNIVIPLTHLLAVPTGFTVCSDRDEAHRLHSAAQADSIFPQNYSVGAPIEQHHTGWSILLAHRGADMQRITASAQARAYARQWIEGRANGRQVVALTLREAPFMTERNSDPAAWGAFARRLLAAGFLPVILRDADMALGPIHPAYRGIETFPEGVLNLDLRMAFYEEAHIHASVANGPCHVCFYDRNVRFLYVVTGDWLRNHPTPFARMGIEFGETPPFANRYQRWVWQEQDPDTLFSEFSALHDEIERDRASGQFEAGLDPVTGRRLPIAELAARFERWTHMSYGTAAEELRLLLACRDLEKPADQPERERLKTMVSLAITANDIDKAITLLRLLGDKFGNTADDHVQLGMLYESRADYANAVDQYAKAIDSKQTAPVVLYRLGVSASQAGNLKLARECFEKLMTGGVRHPDLFVQLGKVYEAMNETGLAAALQARAAATSGALDHGR
jgi:tetratricopeptide (TPR) repeat protein